MLRMKVRKVNTELNLIVRTEIFCPLCAKRHVYVKGVELQIYNSPPSSCRGCGTLLPNADFLQKNFGERLYFHKNFCPWVVG